jgi:hypothetical protein
VPAALVTGLLKPGGHTEARGLLVGVGAVEGVGFAFEITATWQQADIGTL